ncbi:MAG: proton-conducting transporter transmembrane domain-containing protein, partial [Pseudomonadales bacterium]
ILLACAAKSAQLPFSPWLFAAMSGPTPVSALLHAATMVAAGVYLLIRLHQTLDAVAWFAPLAIGLGLATALAGGVVASLQGHAKKLLAASTSSHYGLMWLAVGAGYPGAALLHFVTHAFFKAGLFLAAGIAEHHVGSYSLGDMRLGRK